MSIEQIAAEQEYKTMRRRHLKKVCIGLSICFIAIALGTLCALLTPSSWRWFIKIPIGLITSGVLIWLAAIIEDNIRYNDRKKKQARAKPTEGKK